MSLTPPKDRRWTIESCRTAALGGHVARCQDYGFTTIDNNSCRNRRDARDALARHGKPEIFNTDQGSQFTGAAFTGVLIDNGIAISMDGKDAWRDNVFVDRVGER